MYRSNSGSAVSIPFSCLLTMAPASAFATMRASHRRKAMSCCDVVGEQQLHMLYTIAKCRVGNTLAMNP